MMRKVRVVKYGQKPAMSKPGYSRGFNSGQFPVYYPGTEWTAPSTEVNKGLQPVPWDEANVEAEGGETAYVPDQGGLPAHFNINGPRHSEGGVPLNLPPDTFIYSDTKKMKFNGPILDYFGKNGSKKGKGKKSYTPADLAKQYDINKYRKILQNPDSDDIQRHSAELMIQNYNKKLGALALAQEAKKGFPDGIPVAATPYLMTYEIDPQMVLPTIPQQQDQMPQGQMPMEAMKAGGTWAAPNYYQVGGSYSAQTEPEYGGNWMGQARSRKQYGGEEEQIMQIIQMYAQASGQDPDQLVSQLQQMQPEEAQQALQQMAQELQQAQNQTAGMQPTGYAYGGSFLPKAQKGNKGEKNWSSYSNENDPATGYWDRVSKANVFMRPTDLPESQTVDPRMIRSLEKFIPFYGEEAGGLWPWLKNAALMPQKELNNLLTGYYETPGATVKRYDPTVSSNQQFWTDVATDPLIVPEIPTAIGKGVYKIAGQAVPLIGTAAAATYEAGKVAAKATAEATAKFASYLSNYLPKMSYEKLVDIGARLLQAGYHYPEESAETPAAVAPTGYVAPPATTTVRTVTPTAVQMIDDDILPIGAYDQDSLRKVLGLPPINQRYGGFVPKAQGGFSVKGNKYFYTNPNGKTVEVPKKTYDDYLASISTSANPYSDFSLYYNNAANAANSNWMMPGVSPAGTFINNAAPAAAPSAATTAAPAKGTGKATGKKGVSEYNPYGVDNPDFADVLEPGQVMYTGKVAGLQTKNPKGGFGKQDFDSFKNNNKEILDSFKEVWGTDYDKNNPDHVHWYQRAHYAQTINDLRQVGYDDDEATKVADQLSFNPNAAIGAGDPRGFDDLHGDWTNSRIRFKFKPKKTANPKKGEPAAAVQPGPQPQYVTRSGQAPWWLQDVVNITGSAGDFLRLKKYLPWAPKVEPVVPDPTFYDPTRALAQNAEQMAIGTQGAAAFAGPQQFSARVSGLQAKAAENAANIVGQYSNMNVDAANRFAGQRAGIYNQANQVNAGASQDMYDKTVVANQNYDNAKLKARRDLRQNYIQGLTNKAQAQAMNTMYQDYQVDPTTGGYVYYVPGARGPFEPGQTDSDSSYWSFIEQAKGQGLDAEEASKAWRTMQGSGSSQSSKGRRSNRYGYPGYSANDMMSPYGMPMVYPGDIYG